MPKRAMMSSFFCLWVWAQVIWFCSTSMIFSQYSFSSARLTSTRPNFSKLPYPKSTISHFGLGGRIQPWRWKISLERAMIAFICERFMASPFPVPCDGALWSSGVSRLRYGIATVFPSVAE
ncbi:MAG: hypothetical protein BWY06_02928 [Candidatus Latescibacteria bacterium ADurb.Bin168]|nr:MAG: hypothetical protein BWY06_02928 [Candidatus Latescibacteria bacterium ADurb.Bin168]